MKTHNVDVYVLIKDEINMTGFVPVSDCISKTNGVNRVSMNKYVRSLIEVEYDPEAITGQAILASIRQQGYHASLVGM